MFYDLGGCLGKTVNFQREKKKRKNPFNLLFSPWKLFMEEEEAFEDTGHFLKQVIGGSAYIFNKAFFHRNLGHF